MIFHKGFFPIQCNALVKEKIKVVCGWIDKTNTYGFYKYNNFWKATDLVSGCLICTFSTRKECAKWIEENIKKILEIKDSQRYKMKIENFRFLLKEAIKNEKE